LLCSIFNSAGIRGHRNEQSLQVLIYVKGVSESNFLFVRTMNLGTPLRGEQRAQDRSVYPIHEDSVPSGYSSTVLTQLSRIKNSFGDGLKVGIILMVLSCVSACGQKGPLYHPDREKVSSSDLQNIA